jgi:gas vesicle protein
MAYEYDRLEREDGGGSFLMGLLAGTVLGAGLGMLFAPRAGSELRSQLSEQAGRLRTTAGDGYQQATEKVSQMVDRGKEAYDRARGSAGSTSAGSGPIGNVGTGVGTGTSGYSTSGSTINRS